MFSANSESWSAATVHYTMLRRLAKENGDLETALAPVNQFFAQRSPAVTAEEKAKREAELLAKGWKWGELQKSDGAPAETGPSPAPA